MIATWWNPEYQRPPLPSCKPTPKKMQRQHNEATVQRVLDAVKEGGRTLKEVSAMNGMAESSTRRILYVLRDRGHVVADQSAGTPTYWSAN